jgi:hypothetical protein
MRGEDNMPQEQPTPSTQTNILIMMCGDVLEGKRQPQEIADFVEERKKNLEAARLDFANRIKQEGEEFAVEFDAEIKNINLSFEEYRKALREIEFYFSDLNKSHLESGTKMLVEATQKMILAMQMFESRYVAGRPTKFPFLNVLINSCAALKEGRLTENIFKQMAANAKKLFSEALRDTDKFTKPEVQGAMALLRQGYQEFIAGVEELEQYLADKNEEHFEQGLKIITDSQNLLEQGFQEYQKNFQSAPTPSPFANLVLNAVEGIKNKIYTKEILAESLNILQEVFNKMKAEFDQYTHMKIDSVPIRQEMSKVLRIFDEHQEAVDLIKGYLVKENMEELEQGAERLRVAAIELNQSHEKFMSLAEESKRVFCLQCHQVNLVSDKVCKKCGAVLPKMTEAEVSTFQMKEGEGFVGEGGEIVITENLKRVIDAANDVADHKISLEEFKGVLDWMGGILEEAQLKLKSPILNLNVDNIPEDQKGQFEKGKELVEETKTLFAEGLNNFNAGLARMRYYIEEQNKEHLIEGLRIIWQASQQLYQVQQIGDLAKEASKEKEIKEPKEEAEFKE